MIPLEQIETELRAGQTTSRALTETALARIDDPRGEGLLAFIEVFRNQALAEADASDRLRAAGIVPSPLAGIPVSVKDLFDVAGRITRAGSKIRADADPARTDADIVHRLRVAGAVIIGHTNMTEFAFSGVGLNPHYGTPRNPHDRATGRLPGGSSAGSAVSVTDGMAAAAIGTDTGGSVRIPAALCGLTGFKPTQCRVPLAGAFPLSSSLDSIGPLAPTVSCCETVDAVLSGRAFRSRAPLPLAGLRFGVPQDYVLDDLEDIVATTFERTLTRLSEQGAWIVDVAFPELETLPAIHAKGGLVAAEAWQLFRNRVAEHGDDFDPRVRARIENGSRQDAADYIETLNLRAAMQAHANAISAPFDALLMPTVPMTAPPISDLDDDADYMRINLAMLRNPSVGNFLDRCAVSLPCHGRDDAPVGLTVMGETNGDDHLFQVTWAVESALGRGPTPEP